MDSLRVYSLRTTDSALGRAAALSAVDIDF